MRKYFEGLTPVSGALIFVSIFFGIFLRLYDLNMISHWSDELATIYFSKNLSLVYHEETHPPGFYLITKILFFFTGESVFALRAFVAGSSVVLSLYLSYVAKKIFPLSGWIIFTMILFLIPVDVAYARIGRMYSLLFSLSLWFYLACIEGPSKIIKISILSFILSWIFPIGFLPGLGYLIFQIIRKKFSKHLFFLSASIAPIIAYYLSKKVFLDKKGFLAEYLGGDHKVRNLFMDFFYTMAGDHIPKFSLEQLWPYAWILFAIFTGIVLSVSFARSLKSSGWNLNLDFHLVLIILTIVFVYSFSSSVVNIKLGRYLVFLIPIVCIHAASLGDFEFKNFYFLSTSILASLLVYHLIVYQPLKVFPWEREYFQEFNNYRTNTDNPDAYVFCGNKFQYHYYFRSPHRHCSEVYQLYKSQKADFVFIDMNGYVRDLVFEIKKDYDIYDLQFLGMSTIAKAKFRQKKLK